MLIAFGTGILTILLLASTQIEEKLNNNSKDIDLVVGAKGSPLQLILSSIYYIDFPTGNIPLKEANQLAKNPFVKRATPLALGDNYQGARIVGTDSNFISLYGLKTQSGKFWSADLEVTIGANVAQEHNLKIITIKDMIAYRLKKESIVEQGVEVDMPTEYGHFRIIPFKQKSNGLEHFALIKGEWKDDEPILVRVHSSCATGDILGSKRCDCGEQLHKAMQMIEKEGKGVIVYMQQEGRGIGLMNKLAAYKLQEEGYDTVDANLCLGFKADERDYGCGAQILRLLGVQKMRLMTNNPVKRVGLEAYGLEIVENVGIEITPNEYNLRYLKTKKDRMGHQLHLK
jgi:GTP cyclohydrolase II